LTKLFHVLLAAIVAGGLLASAPVRAAEADSHGVADMSNAELSLLAARVLLNVSAEARKLEPAGRGRDCATLTRSFNALNLGYDLLGQAIARLEGQPPREVLGIRVQIVQARVVAFASRVRAEEWHQRVCRDYVVPASLAADPQYGKPLPVGTAEFTQAAIEARLAAEANLASVVAAARSKKCTDVRSAMQSVQLFIPYLEKLASDISTRPLALGPRASRRALESARGQLVAAANRMYAETGAACTAPQPPAPAESPPPSAPEAAPATPAAP
jgi:hypothetical protein